MSQKRRVKRALAHRSVHFTDESDRLKSGHRPDVLILSEGAYPKAEARFGSQRESSPALWVVVGSLPASVPKDDARTFLALGRESSVAEWRGILDRAIEESLASEAAPAPHRSVSLAQIPTANESMKELVATLRKVANSNISILLLGETGVGKDFLARAIHQESPRHSGPFIAVNCAALPDALLESELFGHTRGAFTDAVRERRGKFELAHGGTLFLDEIGDMPLHLQTKLLRVLQEREVERVGSEESIAIDVRVLAATNQDLQQALARKTFRSDLYYRISGVTFTIPPLRERLDDLLQLARMRIEEACAEQGRSALVLSEGAIRRLMSHSWPGNIRELYNVLDRAVLLASGDTIDASELGPLNSIESPAVATVLAGASVGTGEEGSSWSHLPYEEARAQVLKEFECGYMKAILAKTQGRLGEAARLMGLNPRSVYEKLKRCGIDKREFRSGQP
jgi:transcriptional regulator with GAF, ATPase, and Fis domain